MPVDGFGGILFGPEYLDADKEVYLADYEIELKSVVGISKKSLKKHVYETLIRRLKLRGE